MLCVWYIFVIHSLSCKFAIFHLSQIWLWKLIVQDQTFLCFALLYVTVLNNAQPDLNQKYALLLYAIYHFILPRDLIEESSFSLISDVTLFRKFLLNDLLPKLFPIARSAAANAFLVFHICISWLFCKVSTDHVWLIGCTFSISHLSSRWNDEEAERKTLVKLEYSFFSF